MQPLTLDEIIAAMAGRLHGPITIPGVTSASTDTRTLTAGAIFFAIRGPRFDGHAYVETALEKGATAVVVSDLSGVPSRYLNAGRVVQVADTVEAMGRLAAWYRKQFAARVIAVAGSNGKTTTKDLIAAVLGSKMRGRAAPASFNNAIGVPMTLLSVDKLDEYVVVEIGTNHPGEVAALARIAQPDLAVVTSIGEEHLEFFGDLDAVAAEEFSLLRSLRGRAFAAVSSQAAEFLPADAADRCTIRRYGFDEGADLRASDLDPVGREQRFMVNGRFAYRLPMIGRHNVLNALAAIAVGARFRLPHEEIASALAGVKPSPMRMEVMTVGSLTVLNDAYNANPSSMKAAFETLDQIAHAGRKVLVLGDMRELGDHASGCHQAVGREAGRCSAQAIVAVGAFARVLADGAVAVAGATKRIYSLPTVEAAAEKLGDLIQPGDLVLLKASRAVRLERLVDTLTRVEAKRQFAAAAS